MRPHLPSFPPALLSTAAAIRARSCSHLTQDSANSATPTHLHRSTLPHGRLTVVGCCQPPPVCLHRLTQAASSSAVPSPCSSRHAIATANITRVAIKTVPLHSGHTTSECRPRAALQHIIILHLPSASSPPVRLLRLAANHSATRVHSCSHLTHDSANSAAPTYLHRSTSPHGRLVGCCQPPPVCLHRPTQAASSSVPAALSSISGRGLLLVRTHGGPVTPVSTWCWSPPPPFILLGLLGNDGLGTCASSAHLCYTVCCRCLACAAPTRALSFGSGWQTHQVLWLLDGQPFL